MLGLLREGYGELLRERGIKFDKIYCSPRAIKTAGGFTSSRDKFIIDDDLTNRLRDK